MIRKWLFIDEQLDDGESCARLLGEPGELLVNHKEPEPDLSFIQKILANESYAGVLLDHALNEGSPEISYTGATLAAFIRTEFPELPVVVLSARLKEPLELRRYRRTKELFDLRLDKMELTTDAPRARERLKVLGDGYAKLSSILGCREVGFPEGCTILGLPVGLDDDSERADVARLLLEEGGSDPFRVAQFLLHIVLRLQGPLLDRTRASVASGWDPANASGIQEYLRPAVYAGVFHELCPDGRYWRESLSLLDGPPEGIAPARCCVCAMDPAFEVCESCKQPVDGIHSLPVRRKEVANDVFLRGRLCAFCLAGPIPEHLAIEGRYGRMRDALIAEAKRLQEKR